MAGKSRCTGRTTMAIRAYDRASDGGGARAMDARKANDRIAVKAEQLRFVSRVPMLCECSTPGCRTVVMVGLDEYREIRRTEDSFITAPGHAARGAAAGERGAGPEG